MRTVFVVLRSPRCDLPPRIEQVLKPAHRQTLFAQPSMKTFDPPILRRLARLNVDHLDLPLHCPSKKMPAGELRPVVAADRFLADLIPPVAEAFLKDKIAIGHALLIAKLPDAQQQEAFNAAFRGMWLSEGNQQVLIPVRELAAWIESNILLQLTSAPFDKQDEALVPAAGSCSDCPKRTGFNKLLFADVRKDSCTDPQCFRSKIDAHVAKTLETKPQPVQISSAYNTREGAPLGRNHHVELDIKKAKANGTGKAAPSQKPCEKMTEAIVADGGKRGQIVKVCADPTCRVHHPNTLSPQQIERERAEERKRLEKEKVAVPLGIAYWPRSSNVFPRH